MSKQSPRSLSGVWLGAALWLATCLAAFGIAVLGLLSTERLRSPVEIEAAPAALAVGQVFFLMVLWPLFERRADRGDLLGGLARLAALMLLSAPLVLLSSTLTAVGARELLLGQLLVAVLGVLVVSTVRLPRFHTWYYPALFLMSAVVPFAAYLLLETGGVSTSWAVPISPFWATGAVVAGTADGLNPLLAFGLLGGAATVWGVLRPPRSAGLDANQA
jgi:hypothetical protein